MKISCALFVLLAIILGPTAASQADPFVVVLGIAQDGGVPQAGTPEHPGWEDRAASRYVSCLAVVDPASSQRWIFDCTPDFPEQLHELDRIAPAKGRPGLDGIFLTHAHIGHYTGLIHLGHEVLGADRVPVYAMPRMHEFLEENGPWDQLVRYNNIELKPLAGGEPVVLNERIRVEAFRVPHRQEYSEVVGYRITGPNRTVVFIPDIDSWEEWEEEGTHIDEVVRESSVAYLDATFYSRDELPGRNMEGFPHPLITHSMKKLAHLPADDRGKVRFIHLNHSNPALAADSKARREVIKNGFHVAEELERVDL